MPAPLAPLLDELKPGRSVYLPGTTGELLALAEALRDEPGRARGVRFVSCFVPGMNEFDYAGLHPETRVATFMLPRAMHRSFIEGRVELTPRSYTGTADVLAGWNYDVVVAHVAPPGADGLCSLGIASDFVPLVWPRAARGILVVNPLMPAMRRGPRLDPAEADLVIECESPLVTASSSASTPELDRIAAAVAALIPNGAHIQTGIGGAPGALWGQLRDHRGLVLRSGMANDELRDLAEAAALAPEGGHLVGIAYGSRGFYDYLAESDLVAFASTPETHGFTHVAPLPRFHAVNSALEIDLFGQVNVEWQGARLASGVGGAADFTRAAMASPGGRAIVALPSTAKTGSRIVARLTAPSTSVARIDLDTVVTEHGVAELRDKSMDARAEALTALAAPQFRDALAAAWCEMRRAF